MSVIHVGQHFPIALRDIASVGTTLRRACALVGARNPSTDWYDPMWYVQERALSGITFTLLVDRNVYSNAVALADGDCRPFNDQHRNAAAVLCFAHCCGLRLETRIAILEHELDSGDPRMVEELPRLHRVFSVGPSALADFALGRVQSLALASEAESPFEPATVTITEAHRPGAWWLNYGCALKIACLLRDSSFTKDVDRLLAYLDWCYEEFFFSAGATVYGSLALSPKRRSGMFKKLRGQDAQAAMRGIRNAAWDMTLISEWEIKQDELLSTKNHHLICSFDRAVTDTANTVMCQGFDARARSDLLRARFTSEWDEHDGLGVFGAYSRLARTVDTDGRRPANQQRPLSFWNGEITLLERSLLKSLTGQPE